MTRQVCYVACADDEGRRLDQVLADHACYPSRSAAAKAIENKLVLVKGNPVSKRQLVNTGDPIVYTLNEETIDSCICGEQIPLDVRFEDDDLIVLSKQAGLVCHPSHDHAGHTLVNALVYRYGTEGLCNVQGENDRLGIVHRLDGDTSGLMICARTDRAGYALMKAIRARTIDRRYLALVHGIIVHDTGMIDAPIARAAHERTRMAVREATNAREAVTTLRVLERFESRGADSGYTLLECKLFTGRTHQIRVHLEYIKHPIVGDPLYTAATPKARGVSLGLSRQFLHSYSLSFDHPITGEQLAFHDVLPCDLAHALAMLAHRSEGRTTTGEEILGSLSSS